MILVTGGAGFIGTHTVRALCEQGEECVILQRRSADVPATLSDLPVQGVQADVADLDTLQALGDRFPITGIVHLAVALPWPADEEDPVGQSVRSVDAFGNIVRAAQAWSVRRVINASTIGVYGFERSGGLSEELPLPMSPGHPIPTFKKIFELLGGHLAEATGVEIVNARISGTWGPGGHLPDPFFAAPSLVQAAATGTEPDLSGMVAPAHAEDALDLMYVKDTGRALALLQRADELHHPTYNVATGHPTSNLDVLAALRAAVPGFDFSLPSGEPQQPSWLDITRLQSDTGFEPEYDVSAAVEDYLAWFGQGHER